MTRKIQFTNNAASTLASSITNTATSLNVAPGDGSKFPSLTGSQYFMATLVKSDGTTEVIKVTARSTDTLTITRAAEPINGVSTAYAFSAGDRIELRMTAGSLANELDRLDAAAYTNVLNKSAAYTVVEADISSLIRVSTSSGGVTVTLPQISTLTDDFNVTIAKVSADANLVTVARSGTDTINGGTSIQVLSQWQSAYLIADRSTNTWTVISSGSSNVTNIVDTFTGTGTAGPFTLSGDPGVKSNTAVYVGGVYQQKSTYTLSGTSLTLGGNVASGVSIEVVWTTPLLVTVGTPTDLSLTEQKFADESVSSRVLRSEAISGKVHAATSKATPVDADEITLIDSESTFSLKKLTWANIKATLKAYFDSLYSAPMTGQVAAYAMSTAPSGWLKCNGAAVSRTSYSALFAAIGTTYGAGDGSTTFNLPDLRGEFIRGWDNARGVDGGRAFGSYQADAFQGHEHHVTDLTGGGGGGYTWGGNLTGPKNTDSIVQKSGYSTPRYADETRPRNVALLYCIKY